MSERLQATFILGMLPLLMVLGFAFELHEAGNLAVAVLIATVLAFVFGFIGWRLLPRL